MVSTRGLLKAHLVALCVILKVVAILFGELPWGGGGSSKGGLVGPGVAGAQAQIKNPEGACLVAK